MIKQFTLVVASTLCSVTIPAHADKPGQVRQALQSAYDKENAALTRRDVDGSLAYHSKAFIHANRRNAKITDVADERLGTTQICFSSQFIEANTKISKFAIKGRQAFLVTRTSLFASGTQRTTGKLMRIEQYDIN